LVCQVHSGQGEDARNDAAIATEFTQCVSRFTLIHFGLSSSVRLAASTYSHRIVLALCVSSLLFLRVRRQLAVPLAAEQLLKD
jgi:hypothetical protein